MTTKEDAEKILENLSEEERLELLKRLIQGVDEGKEEELTAEERIERLEDAVLGSHRFGSGKRVVIRRVRGDRHKFSDIDCCSCCN